MGKAVSTVLKVAAVAVGVVAIVASGGLGAGLAGAASGLMFGASAATIGLVASGLTLGASLLAPKIKAPTSSPSNADRLTVSIDVRAPRKIIFGSTALGTDLRDQEYSNDQSVLHRFVVCASHRVNGIGQIWFDDKLAWSSTGGVTADYAGYLTVIPVLEGSAANAINTGPRMGATRRYTGCAYVYFRYKLTGNSKKSESPFSQSIPTRVTIIGDGISVYDPRLDSTAGGSGPCRANDQNTWVWSATQARNPALEMLTYFLGWRINGKLAVGKGVPAARLDLASFITAANFCDEPVSRSAGGSEPRYRADGIFSEADDLSIVLEGLKASMNAVLDDVDGRIRLTVLHNDLATPIGDLMTDDVLGAFTWDQTAPLSDTINVIRGGYTDPSTSSLYQLVDYPEVRVASPDGIERAQTVNLPLVQSASQAQRLIKLRLQRMLYAGTFKATFQATAWRFVKGDVIRLSFCPLGWENKLFRIADMAIQVDGAVPMMLREEHPDIYAWDGSDAAPIVGAAPSTYDPLLWPVALAIDDAGKSAEWDSVIGAGKPADNATNSADPDSPFGNGTVRVVEAKLDQIEPLTLDVSDIKKANVSQDAILRQADRDRAKLAEAQLRGLLDQNAQRVTLRNAGMVTDPDTGRVYIYAVEQTNARVSKVEIGLDAVSGAIALRATYNDVATMITMAQLTPADAAQFGGLISRMNAAEVSISGMTAAIALKADAITVTQLGGIVQSVSQTLDALAGVVSTKVSYSDFTPVRDRVGAVEQTLLSYGDVSSYGITVRQAEMRNTAASAGALAGLISNSENAQRQTVRAAEITQQLTARMDEGDAGEAAARLALAARVGDNEAGLVEERSTRADQVSAQAKRTDLLTATVVDQGTTFDARLISQAKAIADGDTAQADRTDLLTASVTKLGQDTTASFAQQAKAISDGDAASGMAITQLSARVGDFGLVSVQQAFAVLADRTGKLEGSYTLAIDTNGRLQGFKLAGSANGPATFTFIDTDLRMGTGKIVFNNGAFMKVQGVAFGANSDLIEWYGPTMQIAQCTRANAISYATTDGYEYMGGGIAAGVLKNAVQSTMLDAAANVTTGVFGSNGRPRTVTVSLLFYRSQPNTGTCPTSPVVPTATVALHRGSDATGPVLSTQTFNGTFACEKGLPNEPGFINEQIAGGFTFTDTAGGTSAAYFLRLTSRTTNTSPQQQSLGLISVEQ
jgi:hypothetical protein